MAEIDSIRAAAEEELEAQRIYTETANLRNVNVRAEVMSRVGNSMANHNGNGHSANGHSDEMWEMAAVANSDDGANGQPDMGAGPDGMANPDDSRTNKKAK